MPEDLIKMQSDICKTFSNPCRMRIIKMLCKSERSAADIIKETGISKANLSQHMKLLITHNIVIPRRQGVSVFYSLADYRISKACSLMSEVVMETLKRKHDAYKKVNKKGRQS